MMKAAEGYTVTENENQFFIAVKKLFEDYPDLKYKIDPLLGTITIINDEDMTDEVSLQLGTSLGALASFYKVGE